MTKLFVLYVCAAVSPVDCREVPIRATTERAAHREWCAAVAEARRSGELWNAFVLRIDRRWPRSRESYDLGCGA